MIGKSFKNRGGSFINFKNSCNTLNDFAPIVQIRLPNSQGDCFTKICKNYKFVTPIF